MPEDYTSAWALAYLRGRADALRRGKITLHNVEGAVRLALQRGATLRDVETLMARYDLCWEQDSESLIPC
jgi:hypothetical protein